MTADEFKTRRDEYVAKVQKVADDAWRRACVGDWPSIYFYVKPGTVNEAGEVCMVVGDCAPPDGFTDLVTGERMPLVETQRRTLAWIYRHLDKCPMYRQS